MAAHQEQEDQCKKIQYPLNSNSYKILDEIGIGVSAVVYKAICVPVDSTVVAIKAIDLDQSRADLDNIRRETKTMSLLSHPNILNAHCAFTVDHGLWVVMPFMSCGSLQSIISSCFPDGLTEPCIAIVLKETLNALSYLHNQGHVHRDVKAGNVLIDSNGCVKLADFGVSASIYEPGHHHGCAMLTDVAGTPYWMAPEVIHSHNGYSFKADIWSFGITALELAHGRPPLSHLPPSKSLLMKITKSFRFSDYEKTENKKDKNKNKKFSKGFKDMVASCLDQDPSKRPSPEKLLKHSFFKNCKDVEFLVKNLLHGLPSVEDRFKESKSVIDRHEDDEDFEFDSSSVRERRISGWNFNEEGFELDPVFPFLATESRDDQYDAIVKQVRFGGEAIIPDHQKQKQSEYSDNSEESNLGSTQIDVVHQDQEPVECVGGIDTETVMGGLMALRRSLDEQRQQVSNMIVLLGGEMSREDQLMQITEKLKKELETEKRKNFELEMELEFLKLQVSGAYNSGGSTDI